MAAADPAGPSSPDGRDVSALLVLYVPGGVTGKDAVAHRRVAAAFPARIRAGNQQTLEARLEPRGRENQEPNRAAPARLRL
jgi:hypothetical protein